MGLRTRLRRRRQHADISGPGLDAILDWYRTGGLGYTLNQTLQGDQETIANDFCGYVHGAYQRSGPIFALIATRMMLLSEARFAYRQRRNGRAGDLFSDATLDILSKPWPGGTTGDLIARCELDSSLAGTAFVARRQGADRLSRLRPDWTTMVIANPNEDGDGYAWDPDAELIGVIYQPGGPSAGHDPVKYLASEVAVYAPIPDPLAPMRGMSWLSPVIDELLADRAMTKHNKTLIERGGTYNMVLNTPLTELEKLQKVAKEMAEGHEGLDNKFKNLALLAGWDAKVVGASLKDLDFAVIQAAGETRLAAAARIHPSVVGFHDGLQGSALNAGNFESALSQVANLWARPSWRNLAGSLAAIVPPPPGSELWYDDRDIPALQAAEKDRADAMKTKSESISSLVTSGFTRESAVAAVAADDVTLLEADPDALSVQLRPGSNGNGATHGLDRRQA